MFQQDIFQGPGTGTFTSHTLEIIIMLAGAFLIGLWFGWVLWSRYRQTAERLRVDNESLNASVSALRLELDTLKARLAETETENASLRAQADNLNWENENHRGRLALLESDMAKLEERNRQLESELGLARQPESGASHLELEVTAPLPAETHDELPDLEEAIANAVEDSFDAANLNLPELEDAVTEAVAAAVAQHTAPEAPEPAEMPAPEEQAASTLVVLPELEPVAPVAESADEPLLTAVAAGPRDDLKIVEGIGPKIEEILFKAGITTYGQLAATSVQQLKDILTEAGPRFVMHDPGTWSAQALLAANGEWENLKAYQDFLNAGKRPDK